MFAKKSDKVAERPATERPAAIIIRPLDKKETTSDSGSSNS
ncbi:MULTISPECIES: hypothetical protein [unclassified Nocardia]|nr:MULTISPECIES: hypothetical protein [unclassified Nocardia]